MESNISEPEFSNSAAPIPEPHFDEEATVLSARPVVPLEKVNAKSRLTRPWLFVGALAAALLLGISVTAIYYSQLLNRKDSRLATHTENIRSGVEAAATENHGDSAAPAPRTAVASDTPLKVGSEGRSIIEPPAPSSEISKKPVARRVDVITYKSGSSDGRAIHEERKAARIEEQRRRQQGERRDTSSGDLTRIREIFEGSRRP